jgi:hypothetical protein
MSCEQHTKYDGSYWVSDARGIPPRACLPEVQGREAEEVPA